MKEIAKDEWKMIASHLFFIFCQRKTERTIIKSHIKGDTTSSFIIFSTIGTDVFLHWRKILFRSSIAWQPHNENCAEQNIYEEGNIGGRRNNKYQETWKDITCTNRETQRGIIRENWSHLLRNILLWPKLLIKEVRGSRIKFDICDLLISRIFMVKKIRCSDCNFEMTSSYHIFDHMT